MKPLELIIVCGLLSSICGQEFIKLPSNTTVCCGCEATLECAVVLPYDPYLLANGRPVDGVTNPDPSQPDRRISTGTLFNVREDVRVQCCRHLGGNNRSCAPEVIVSVEGDCSPSDISPTPTFQSTPNTGLGTSVTPASTTNMTPLTSTRSFQPSCTSYNFSAILPYTTIQGTTSTTPTPPPTTPSTGGVPSGGSDDMTAVIVGAVIGGLIIVVLAILIIVIGWWVCRSRSARKKADQRNHQYAALIRVTTDGGTGTQLPLVPPPLPPPPPYSLPGEDDMDTIYGGTGIGTGIGTGTGTQLPLAPPPLPPPPPYSLPGEDEPPDPMYEKAPLSRQGTPKRSKAFGHDSTDAGPHPLEQHQPQPRLREMEPIAPAMMVGESSQKTVPASTPQHQSEEPILLRSHLLLPGEDDTGSHRDSSVPPPIQQYFTEEELKELNLSPTHPSLPSSALHQYEEPILPPSHLLLPSEDDTGSQRDSSVPPPIPQQHFTEEELKELNLSPTHPSPPSPGLQNLPESFPEDGPPQNLEEERDLSPAPLVPPQKFWEDIISPPPEVPPQNFEDMLGGPPHEVPQEHLDELDELMENLNEYAAASASTSRDTLTDKPVPHAYGKVKHASLEDLTQDPSNLSQSQQALRCHTYEEVPEILKQKSQSTSALDTQHHPAIKPFSPYVELDDLPCVSNPPPHDETSVPYSDVHLQVPRAEYTYANVSQGQMNDEELDGATEFPLLGARPPPSNVAGEREPERPDSQHPIKESQKAEADSRRFAMQSSRDYLKPLNSEPLYYLVGNSSGVRSPNEQPVEDVGEDIDSNAGNSKRVTPKSEPPPRKSRESATHRELPLSPETEEYQGSPFEKDACLIMCSQAEGSVSDPVTSSVLMKEVTQH